MENKDRKYNGDAIYPEGPRRSKGPGKTVFIIGLVFLLAAGAIVFSMRQYYQSRFVEQTRHTALRYYTPDKIETILVEAVPDWQEGGTAAAYQVHGSDFLGEGLSKEVDLARLYYTIREYEPVRKVPRYQVRNLYAKYISKAYQARETGRYQKALYYYKLARQIRPGSWYVRRSINEVREVLNAIYQRENLNFLRSYDRIKAVAESKLDHIRYLYNREKTAFPYLIGSISIELHIRPDGSVTNPKVIRSNLYNEQFEDKLLNAIRLWQFRKVNNDEKDMCLLVRYNFKGKDNITLYTGESCSGENI